MKRGPFYLITPDDFRKMAECVTTMHEMRRGGREEDEITFTIIKWYWADKEHFDLRPVERGYDWKQYWPDAKELGEYHVSYRIEEDQFFQHVIEEGWLECD